MSLLTRVYYSAEQDQTDFAVPFPYLNKTHVKVSMEGVPMVAGFEYTWLNDGTIQFNFPLNEDNVVYIRRRTPITQRMVVFQDGAFLNENHMNTDSNQLFFKLQELLDWSTSSDPQFYDRDQILDLIWGWLDESAFLEHLRHPLSYLREIWGWDALFAGDVYAGDVFNNLLETLPPRIQGAEIRIDDAESLIQLQAGTINEIDQRVTNAQIDIDGLNAAIVLKADQLEVDDAVVRLTQAEINIDGVTAEVQLKASQIEVDDLEVRLSGAELRLDGAEATIELNVMQITQIDEDLTYQAGQMALMTDQWWVKLDVNGYVTGVGMYNEGATSEFIVLIDKFAIVKPGGGPEDTKAPFVVNAQTGMVGIDGALVVTGTVAANRIAVGDIDLYDLGGSGDVSALANDVTILEGDVISLGQQKQNAIVDNKTLIIGGYLNTDFIQANSIVAGKLVIGGIDALGLKNAPTQAGADRTGSNTSFNTSRVGTRTASQIVGDISTLQVAKQNAIVDGRTLIVGGYLDTHFIEAGTIVASKIAAGAITADKISAGTIYAGHIVAGQVTTTKIQNGGVTTPKLAAYAATKATHGYWGFGGYMRRQSVSVGWYSTSAPSQHDVQAIWLTIPTGGCDVGVDTNAIIWYPSGGENAANWGDHIQFRVQVRFGSNDATRQVIYPSTFMVPTLHKTFLPGTTILGGIAKLHFNFKFHCSAGTHVIILQSSQHGGGQDSWGVYYLNMKAIEYRK